MRTKSTNARRAPNGSTATAAPHVHGRGNQFHGGAYAGEATPGRRHFLRRAKRFGVIRTKTPGTVPRTAPE